MSGSVGPSRYPKTRRLDLVEDLHGRSVADPYRWLEDIDAPEVTQWIGEQNALAASYIEGESRQRIRARLEALLRVDRRGVPRKRGDRYFFSRQRAHQQQPEFRWAAAPREDGTLLLDSNTLSSDGTVSVSLAEPSPDGRLWVYGTSEGGSDWTSWRVRDVDTGQARSDHLRWIKFSPPTWSADSAGVFYNRYPVPASDKDILRQENRQPSLCYHRIGEDQSCDALVYERPEEPDWGFETRATEEGDYLILSVWKGTHREKAILLLPLTTLDAEGFARSRETLIELRPGFDAEYRYLTRRGSWFYFTTDHGAPRGCVVAIDIHDPHPDRWRTIVAESEDSLESAAAGENALILVYLHHAHSRVVVHDLDGTLRHEVPLPEMGSVRAIEADPESSEFFFAFENFLRPLSILRGDAHTGNVEALWEPDIPFRGVEFETRQVFVESTDGARVPVFLTQRRGQVNDGQAPTYLYGYGGFGLSEVPRFATDVAVWLEMGGLYAHACLRGGGEYGTAWREAGRRDLKQHTFDDFIATAEWLCHEGYTRSDRLAIGGRSNGGLLVGACLVQRPDLFGAALPSVGVLDMLRFHKFTIGWAWVSDYGSPDDPQDFTALLAYSPYHNARPAEYPATLILTADHDDRVFPAHSFKFAAALQHAQRGAAPILLRVTPRAGHGAGRSTEQLISDATDAWSFLQRALEMETVFT